MAHRIINDPQLGHLEIRKNPRARAISIRFRPDGVLRLTVPSAVPMQAALLFARSKRAWIEKHRPKQANISPGQNITSDVRVEFRAAQVAKPRGRLMGNTIMITHPSNLPHEHPEVQSAARSAITRHLKREAESILPDRLLEMSRRTGLPFQSVRIKQLKSRWGSCDQGKHIILNLYLLVLPEHLIDYVLAHELAHTVELSHSPRFWSRLGEIIDDPKAFRRELKTYQPYI